MTTSQAFTTKLPPELKEALDHVCRRFGLKKSFVVEQALREKLEDLVDTFDLEDARSTAVVFRKWEEVEQELRERRKL